MVVIDGSEGTEVVNGVTLLCNFLCCIPDKKRYK